MDKVRILRDIHDDYTKRLREWEKAFHIHHVSKWMHQVNMYNHTNSTQNSSRATQLQNGHHVSNNNSQPRRAQVIHAETTVFRGAVDCIPAPVLSRFLAEAIDGIILILFKTIVICVMSQLFNYDVELSMRFVVIDNNLNDEITTEDLQYMLLVGLFYRFIACFYEAAFITYCGATPGKQIMGIEVVSCDHAIHSNIIPQQPDALLVLPGGKPSWIWSWVRCMIKNFSVAFLLPTFATMFMYANRRTSYDILSKTIVIKRIRIRLQRIN